MGSNANDLDNNLPDLDDGTGNAALARTLQNWGISLYSGVNGGGVIHFAKYLRPLRRLDDASDPAPQLFTINEDIASFIPIGHYWSSGKIAASLFTTGGAAYYGATGLIGAKAHNVPMVAIAALSASDADGKSPLQYTGTGGAGTIGSYKSLLGDGCLVIDYIGGLEEKLIQGREILQTSKPVAFLFHPDILSKNVEKEFDIQWTEKPREVNPRSIEWFLSDFPKEVVGKRVVVYIGEEATRYENIKDLITEFSARLQAPTLYSMNSVNAVSPNNTFAAGYIHFGFNDFSMELWKSLNENDVVICIGYDPGEYEMNSANIPGNVWHFTNETNPYSSTDGGFAHRVEGKYRQIRGDLELTLKNVIEGLGEKDLHNIPIAVPYGLNNNEDYGPFAEGTVDLVEFYKKFPTLIKPDTVIVNDVNQSYKDFQRVTQRPLPGLEVYSSHRDSFMSGGFGVAIGAKLAQPDKEVDYFTGDGCFKYIGGALGFAQNFGIGLWVIDNGIHHTVDKGLDVIYGDSLARERHHGTLPRDNYVNVARAQGWDGYHLMSDLGNLPQIMEQRYNNASEPIPTSTLIQMPVDGTRVIGQNARLLNLGMQGRSNL